MDLPIVVKGRMSELFPVDDPATPWLIRLMIIRDDLEYEFRNIWLDKGAPTEDAWRCTYFLRRMTISLKEARGVLSFDAGKESKREKDVLMLALAAYLHDTVTALEKASLILEPLRNAVGAHLRPQSVDPKGGGVEARVIRNCSWLEGEASISLADFHQTTYRALTINSLTFAWPDLSTHEEHIQRHLDMRDTLLSCVSNVINSIDHLLIRHWWSLGLVKLPEGFDLAVVNPKTGMTSRLPSRPDE